MAVFGMMTAPKSRCGLSFGSAQWILATKSTTEHSKRCLDELLHELAPLRPALEWQL
jgi:hypothetical protein